jgi:hypothetical protein
MFFIPDNELDYLCYAAGLIWRAINIEDQDHSGELFRRQLIRLDVFSVDEKTGCSAVYLCTDPLLLLSFRALNFYLQVKRI